MIQGLFIVKQEKLVQSCESAEKYIRSLFT